MMTIILSASVFVISIVLLVVMILKTKSKKKKNHTDELSVSKLDKSISDIVPISRYDIKNQCYVYEDGRIMDFIKINTKDLINASENDLQYDFCKLQEFYMLYSDDFKFVSLNYPCNTQTQQAYIQKKITETNNQTNLYWLNKKLQELKWLESNKTYREYYLQIFAKNLDDYHKKMIDLSKVLGNHRDGLLEILGAKKKHQILYKMNNKSCLIS